MSRRKSVPKLVAHHPSDKKGPQHFRSLRVIGMTDPQRWPHPERALESLPAHAALIWRLFGATPKRARLQALTKQAHRKKCRLLISAPEGPLPCSIDGVHLPGRLLARRQFRNLPKPDLWVTAAVHSERALVAAKHAGVHAVLISPVFATASHQMAKPLGVVRFAQLARLACASGLAVYALGGMSAAQMRRLNGIPLAGFAGIAFLETEKQT